VVGLIFKSEINWNFMYIIAGILKYLTRMNQY
jgi:hypothetical protein